MATLLQFPARGAADRHPANSKQHADGEVIGMDHIHLPTVLATVDLLRKMKDENLLDKNNRNTDR